MPINKTKSSINDETGKCLQSVDQERNITRRTVIRKLAIGSAALAGCSMLPKEWTTPVMEFGSLPAHAITSGEIKEALDKIVATATSEVPEEVEDSAVAAARSEEAAVPEETQNIAAAGTGKFSLVFSQSVMACASCGIWFDSAKLTIKHSDGTFTSSQSGSMLIKKTRGSANFNADLSGIPASATIQKATLVMSLNTHEGIANSDFKSVITVHDSSGDFVRTITARDDIRGKGYSKGNPHVPIDFTDYAKKVHGQ
ncbi:MAG: hypothetical protein Q3M30_04380 [Candidatus Electrothrix sp. Rat3]|nr:hypothetical protein [Candidatus Electrothrix rattekaaiensis]